jgi:hypothetical protein
VIGEQCKKGKTHMSEPTQGTTSPTTSIVARQTSTAVVKTGVNSRTSTILQNVAQSKEGSERSSKLYGGPIEFSKPGYPPFTLSHLVVYTFGDETLAILSSKPQMITHREAAEQIAKLLSINPRSFLYLSRVCAGPEGKNMGLCRDLLTEYAFDWEWTLGSWHVTNLTYCYRVTPEVEAAVQQLLTIEASVDINVIDANL